MSSMLATLLLMTAACGDDGPKVLSADDLATEISGVCRTADRALGDLDQDDDRYFDDATDALQDALDSLAKLKPAKDEKADFDDLLVNLGDQQDELTDLAAAVDDDDADAQSKGADRMVSLQEASDELTDSLGSRSCFGADSIVVDVGLSEAELAEEMNRICSAGRAQLDDLDVDVSDLSKFWGGAADIFAGVRDDLAALKPPASLSQDYAELLDDFDKLIVAVRDLAESSGFEFDDFDAAADLTNAKAAELGSAECADLSGGGSGLES